MPAPAMEDDDDIPWPLVTVTRYGSLRRVRFAGTEATLHAIAPKVASARYLRRCFLRDIVAMRRGTSCLASTMGMFEFGEGAQTLLCVITENLEAGTMRDVLDDRRDLPNVERSVLALGAASSVCALHSAGLLHRCVRSSSFIVTARGGVKLLAPELSRRTQCHRRCGRPAVPAAAYTSPQLLDNVFMRYRLADEVYSFGVVLWEIITGLDPFSGLSSEEIAVAATQGFRDPLHSNNAALVSVIDACRAFAPSKRPSMREAVDALRLACYAVCV
uniref:Protein kinase domain-containing protein n=1 Tax=Rousettus bat poxvirus TaxID=3141933 RepID=A0AAU7E0L5_9POXV